jgi:hypothetical protein
MKRFSIVCSILLTAGLVSAGTYSITTSTVQDNRLERARVRTNKATCGALSLPASCTQAQARAKDSSANIYSSVSDFLDRYVIKNYTDGLKVADTVDDLNQAQAAWIAASDSGKNAICQSFGLPSSCELWPR